MSITRNSWSSSSSTIAMIIVPSGKMVRTWCSHATNNRNHKVSVKFHDDNPIILSCYAVSVLHVSHCLVGYHNDAAGHDRYILT